MEPFIGQITLFPFNFAPIGWALCAGQLMPIRQNTALFSLLGTIWRQRHDHFCAARPARPRPDRARPGAGLSIYNYGRRAGRGSGHADLATIPPHSHAFPAVAAAATTNAPNGALACRRTRHAGEARFAVNTYAALETAVQPGFRPGRLRGSGGAAHNNLQPYLTLNWCIALQGIFPARH